MSSLPFINPEIKVTGIIFQNKHGSKYYSHYYLTPKEVHSECNLTIPENQSKFEDGLRSKVQRMNVMSAMQPNQTEIFTFQSYAVLFKIIDELQIYLIVPEDENYVLMEQVINVIGEVLLMVTKGPYTGKIIFDYLQDIFLVADEVIHQGYIVCLDSSKIYDRLKMKDSGVLSNSPTKPAITQNSAQQPQTGTFSNIFGFAKNTFNRTLNLG